MCEFPSTSPQHTHKWKLLALIFVATSLKTPEQKANANFFECLFWGNVINHWLIVVGNMADGRRGQKVFPLYSSHEANSRDIYTSIEFRDLFLPPQSFEWYSCNGRSRLHPAREPFEAKSCPVLPAGQWWNSVGWLPNLRYWTRCIYPGGARNKNTQATVMGKNVAMLVSTEYIYEHKSKTMK